MSHNLGSLLEELYTHTDSQRRKDIEKLLAEKFGGKTRCQSGLDLLQSSYTITDKTQFFIQFFAVFLLEESVQNRQYWVSNIDQQLKNNIKKALFEALVSGKLQTAIANKVSKVIIEIAKVEWPAQFPEFMTTLLQLCSRSETVITGLTLLTMLSEEIIYDRADLPVTRKNELRNHLTQNVGQIITMLEQLLSTLYQQYTRDTKFFAKNAQLRTVVRKALETLLQYLGWIELDEKINWHALYKTVFSYATLAQQHTEQSHQEIALHAINCLNELIIKEVDEQEEPLLVEIFKMITYLLEHIVNSNKTPEDLENSFDSRYLEVVTNLTISFVQNHIGRMEESPKVSTEKFISLVFQYTFLQYNVDLYTACLDIWISYLSYIEEQEDVKKYESGFVSLVQEIIKRAQFTGNDIYVSELHNEGVQVRGNSELDLYLEHCLECVEMVVNLYASSVLRVLTIPNYDERKNNPLAVRDIIFIVRVFGRIASAFAINFDENFMYAAQAIKELVRLCSCDSLDLVCESFDSLLSIVPLWAPKLEESSIQNAMGHYQQVMIALMDLISKTLGSNTNPSVCKKAAGLLFQICTEVQPPFLTDMQQFGQLYQNLPEWMNSVTKKFIEVDATELTEKMFVSVSSAILNKTGGEKQALLQWKQNTYRSMFMQPLIVQPYMNFVKLLSQNNAQALAVLPRYLRLITAVIDSAEDEGRKVKRIVCDNLTPVIESLLPLLRHFVQHPQVIDSVLSVITALFGSLKYQITEEFTDQTISTLLELFFANGNSNQSNNAALQLLDKLTHDNSGRRFIIHFLQLLTAILKETSEEDDDDEESGDQRRERLLQLTGRIVQISRERIFPLIKHLLTNHATLSKDQLDFVSELLPVFYKMVYVLIEYSWSYFYVLAGAAPLQEDDDEDAIDEREDEEDDDDEPVRAPRVNRSFEPRSQQSLVDLAFLLECVIYSFYPSPIVNFGVVRKNLINLGRLDESHALFSRPAFMNGIYIYYVQVLMRLLVSQQYKIVAEDIIDTLYQMSGENDEDDTTRWQIFENKFLPAFLTSDVATTLSPDQANILRSTLIRDAEYRCNKKSFYKHIKHFVNDFCYFVKANSLQGLSFVSK